MTEPLTVTVLDARTQDELQPPCEASVCDPRDAEWAARFRCDSCGYQPVQLFCDTHFQNLVDRHSAICTGCNTITQDYTLVWAEQL